MSDMKSDPTYDEHGVPWCSHCDRDCYRYDQTHDRTLHICEPAVREMAATIQLLHDEVNELLAARSFGNRLFNRPEEP